MFFRDAAGQLRSMPTRWTSVAAPDAFVVVAAGRSFCRIEDLLALVALLRDMSGTDRPAAVGGEVTAGVREITPQV